MNAAEIYRADLVERISYALDMANEDDVFAGSVCDIEARDLRELLKLVSTPPATEVGIEPLVERVARAIGDALPESDRLTLAPSQIKRAARAAIAASTRTPEQVEEALRHIQSATEYAYANGLHEFGYDPVDTVRAAIAASTRTPEAVDVLVEALEELCDSIEREEELNGSISGTLMSDVRQSRAALAQVKR